MVINYSGARQAIEALYSGSFDVIEYGSFEDPVTHITRQGEFTVFTGLSGRISFETISANNDNGIFESVTQQIVLFTAPEHLIKPGSKIEITQNGRTVEYESSGLPAVYVTHQEIPLKLFKGWA